MYKITSYVPDRRLHRAVKLEGDVLRTDGTLHKEVASTSSDIQLQYTVLYWNL